MRWHKTCSLACATKNNNSRNNSPQSVSSREAWYLYDHVNIALLNKHSLLLLYLMGLELPVFFSLCVALCVVCWIDAWDGCLIYCEWYKRLIQLETKHINENNSISIKVLLCIGMLLSANKPAIGHFYALFCTRDARNLTSLLKPIFTPNTVLMWM